MTAVKARLKSFLERGYKAFCIALTKCEGPSLKSEHLFQAQFIDR